MCNILCSVAGQIESLAPPMPLELQLEEEHVCLYEPFTLVCKHPDLSVQTDDGRYYYTTGTPVWEQDGQIVTVDSVAYSIDYVNKTDTRLVVAPGGAVFNGSQSINFTCFVQTILNITVRSNNVTVYSGQSKCMVIVSLVRQALFNCGGRRKGPGTHCYDDVTLP